MSAPVIGAESSGCFRIDWLKMVVKVRPLRGLDRLIPLDHGKRKGMLYADNAARISRFVRFSKENKCRSPYSLSYRTRNGGYIGEPRSSHRNEASPADLRRYRDQGCEAVFSLQPDAGTEYSMEFDLWKGFDQGHRDVHVHVPERTTIAKLQICVDLSEYISAGYHIDFIHAGYDPEAAAEHCAGSALLSPNLIEGNESQGATQWTVDGANRGCLEAAWGVWSPPAAPALFDLSQLARGLQVKASLAKDLQVFAKICSCFVHGDRSFPEMALRMGVNKSELGRSVKRIETEVGTELCRRSNGRGVFEITAPGNAVFEWWTGYWSHYEGA
jgi:hypothetical protein